MPLSRRSAIGGYLLGGALIRGWCAPLKVAFEHKVELNNSEEVPFRMDDAIPRRRAEHVSFLKKLGYLNQDVSAG
jgi:hypothetical protein